MNNQEALSKIIKQVSENRIFTHIQNLEGVRHPRSNPQGLKRAETYIQMAFNTMGYRVILQPFQDDGIKYHNVLAHKIGTRTPQQLVIALAHFDTVMEAPGADDNASGVAAMLEIAYLLRDFPLDRSVYYAAVNLVENKTTDDKSGLRGSLALSNLARQENWDIRAVLNLETIAVAGEDIEQKTHPGVPFKLPEKGNFIGIIGNQNSQFIVDTFTRVIQEYQIPLPCVPLVVPGNGEVIPDVRRSDHANFWDAGFPAVMITDTANFRSPHYHTAGDTLDTLNIPFTANVCRASLATLVELANN